MRSSDRWREKIQALYLRALNHVTERGKYESLKQNANFREHCHFKSKLIYLELYVANKATSNESVQ